MFPTCRVVSQPRPREEEAVKLIHEAIEEHLQVLPTKNAVRLRVRRVEYAEVA